MEVIEVDNLTVFIAAAVYMIIGFIWYTPLLFGKRWMKANQIKESEKPKNIFPKIVVNFINSLVIAFFLALLLAFLGSTSTTDGIYAAVGAWFGFVVTTQLPLYIWSNKDWVGYFIDIGYYFVGFASMGAILGA